MASFKGGMGGGNMQNLMKQAQKMQEQLQETEKLLDDWEIVGTSGGEAVAVYMNAKRSSTASSSTRRSSTPKTSKCSKTSSWRRSTTAIKRRTKCTKKRWGLSAAAWEGFCKCRCTSNPSAG